MTEDEFVTFKETLLTIDDALNNRLPKEFGDAYDIFLRDYGWHMRLEEHPNKLIPFMLRGNKAIDRHFIRQLRWSLFFLWTKATRRFPKRRKMINSAFKAHLRSDYTASVPLFLILSEGIFRDLCGEDLFTKGKKSKMENFTKRNPDLRIFPLISHIIDAVSNGDIIGLRFSDEESLKYPNVLSRNKILHGADLSYGTKVNSYKAISQFEFVVENVYKAVTNSFI
ncbi:hypothetical protein [Sphingobacterium tabacisoli]|uniref:RiboL-PSP-HEPN domain-containing protein n=1 Tax=Sphingobacterium tabacisoli TaxID=2044855 RepID=A0ABW5L7J5_9SPHI|nr:hypothetical protein [Sphingobacterium tabacisoli]